MRLNDRANDQLRKICFTRNYLPHAEGSVLTEFGNTKVLCTASVIGGVPRFLKGKGQGWITAEYGMLPRATLDRTDREAARGKQSGRTQEIQRLIGRSLRTMVDLSLLGENTITLDCDVIQADGGTRTAAITGASIALADALQNMRARNLIKKSPLRCMVAAVSVGICGGQVLLDLNYQEDSSASTDMNVIMNDQGMFIEVQGTAEKQAYTRMELTAMLDSACQGIMQLQEMQRAVLGDVAKEVVVC